MNIKKDELEHMMTKNQVEQQKVERILKELESLQKEKADEQKQQKKEYKYIGVILDNGANIEDSTIFLNKMEVNEDHNEVFDRILAAKNAYNQSKKGKKSPVDTINGVFHEVPKKILRENNLKFVGDAPITLIKLKNEL